MFVYELYNKYVVMIPEIRLSYVFGVFGLIISAEL